MLIDIFFYTTEEQHQTTKTFPVPGQIESATSHQSPVEAPQATILHLDQEYQLHWHGAAAAAGKRSSPELILLEAAGFTQCYASASTTHVDIGLDWNIDETSINIINVVTS